MTTHGRNVWVVRDGRKFSIREEGGGGRLIHATTQRTAIRIARLLAQANSSELIVQSCKGRIRIKDSHGFDSPYAKG